MTRIISRRFSFYYLRVMLAVLLGCLFSVAHAESYRIVTNPDYSRPEQIKVYINGQYAQNHSPYENELYSIELMQGKYHVEVVRLLNDKEEYFGTTTLDTNSYDNSSIFLDLRKRNVRTTQQRAMSNEPVVERVPTASTSRVPVEIKSASEPENKQDGKLHLDKAKELAIQQAQAREEKAQQAKIKAQADALEKKRQAELEQRMREMELNAEKKIAATEKALKEAQAKAEQQLAATEKALKEAQEAAEKQMSMAKAAQKSAEEQLLVAQKLSQAAEKISQYSLDKINTKTEKAPEKAQSDEATQDDKKTPQAKSQQVTADTKIKSISDNQLASQSSSNLLVDEHRAIKHVVDDDSALELETILLYRAMTPRTDEKSNKPRLKIGHYATLKERQAVKRLQGDIKNTVKTFELESRPESSVMLEILLNEAQEKPARAIPYAVKQRSQKADKPFKSSVWPQMVEIPAGNFIIGCQHKTHCTSEEKPAHRVSVEAFRLANTEVTFRQWEICVEAGVCREVEDDRGWGREDRPVINVSWEDAQKYANWLSDKKGKRYRLPTEKEWEYAARAGTESLFFSGNCLTTKQANFNSKLKDKLSVECASTHQEYRGKTLRVAHFKPNNFDLYDMHGNVWEWTQSCWKRSYDTDSQVESKGDSKAQSSCKNRVLRGGAWHSPVNNLRSSYRFRYSQDTRSFDVGFRVASDI